jgi:peptidylprolyl isomerase
MQPTTIAIAVGASLAFVGVAFSNYYLNLLRPEPTAPADTESYQQDAAPVPSAPRNSVTVPMTDSSPVAGNPVVVLKTSQGDIAIELFMNNAPLTAGNFLKLAEENYYDGTKFHRVIKDFMIQGGDPLTKDDAQMQRWGTGGPGYTIADEFAPGTSNVRGTISMANAGPNTGGSQFFINHADNTFLDGKHAVFGRVVSGMEFVDTIASVATNPRDVPQTPVVISDITRAVVTP